MSKKLLINAQRPEQLRVAIIEGTDLVDYQVESAEAGLCRGNIYRGVVANVQPSLNAAFIDIGEDRHAFLSVDDVHPKAYHHRPPEGVRRPRIDQVLERRRPIEVQVTKDGIGQKGPALTTNLALAGRYLVFMPHDETRAISRKAEGESAREKVRERLAKLNLPEGAGVIVRTNGLDQNQTTLNRDLNALVRLWRDVRKESNSGRGPKMLYSDQDLIVQALRDYLDNTFDQVLVDSDEAYSRVEAYMKAFMPRSKTRLSRYRERLPLFSRYHLEPQIDSIYEREVELPGGGSIVIDSTEALTAIDVNSRRATKTSDHEESIFQVNMEAAMEVGRQLRLRDIGGLVVIDFIDMRLRKHQRKLEKAMRDAMKQDKARNSVGRISPNGLVEINRQRIKQALRLRTHRACPTCHGVGSIPGPEFAALSVLRRIEARVASGNIQAVTVALHPEIADALQNHHRQELAGLEQELTLSIEIISSPGFKRSEERIDWVQREASSAEPVKAVPALRAADLGSKDTRRRKAQSTKAEAETDDKEAAAEAKPKRRRRRRRKPSSETKTDAPAAAGLAAPTADDDAPEQVDASSQEGAGNGEGDAAEEGRPKRRRRRGGRRRRKSDGDAESAAKDATSASQSEPASAQGQEAPAEEAESKPAPKRRRRTSSRSNATHSQDSNGNEDGEAKPRSRSRRRRRPADDPGATPGSDAQARPATPNVDEVHWPAPTSTPATPAVPVWGRGHDEQAWNRDHTEPAGKLPPLGPKIANQPPLPTPSGDVAPPPLPREEKPRGGLAAPRKSSAPPEPEADPAPPRPGWSWWRQGPAKEPLDPGGGEDSSEH